MLLLLRKKRILLSNGRYKFLFFSSLFFFFKSILFYFLGLDFY
jgi:hypothetical protein